MDRRDFLKATGKAALIPPVMMVLSKPSRAGLLKSVGEAQVHPQPKQTAVRPQQQPVVRVGNAIRRIRTIFVWR